MGAISPGYRRGVAGKLCPAAPNSMIVALDRRFAPHHWRQLLSFALEWTGGPNTVAGCAPNESCTELVGGIY